MKLLIDNALSPRVAELLRDERIDALHVRELGMQRDSDAAILSRASTENRIVVSRDADFAGLLAHGNLTWPSFVHLRIPDLHDPAQQVQLLLQVLQQVVHDLEDGAIVSVQSGRVRVRRLPVAGI